MGDGESRVESANAQSENSRSIGMVAVIDSISVAAGPIFVSYRGIRRLLVVLIERVEQKRVKKSFGKGTADSLLTTSAPIFPGPPSISS